MGAALGPVFTFIGQVFGIGAAATGGWAVAVQVARIGLLALAAKVSQPKLDLTQTAFEKNVTVRDPVAPQRIIYGEDMISGPLLFANVAGTDNKDLYFLIGLTGHEIDSFRSFRIDDTDIALTDLSGAEDGTVDLGPLADVAEVEVRHGTSTQAVMSLLNTAFVTDFTAAHTGRGWSMMTWKFSIVEGEEDKFESGIPRNMRALIRGKKVYDPRLDDTNGGTGPHRLATPSTWEWSDNPALCWADWKHDTKFGLREDYNRIDWAMVITAANICDQTVAIPTASTQKRYTCNATFSSTESRGTVEDALLGAMLGRMVFSQGKWRVWAGAAITPDVTLDETNLAGSIQVQVSAGSKERYNRVRGKFVDASRDYVATAYVEQRSSTYVTEDGSEVRELIADFLHTNNDYEAQRKAIITLKRSRNQRVLTFEGNWSCFRIQPGTTVTLNIDELGFAGEKFFVTEWTFGAEGVVLTLVQETDSVWADPLEGDYSTRTATGVIVFGETGVPAPSSLTATTLFNGVALGWINPPENLFTHIEIWASETNVRGNAVLVATASGNTYLDVSSAIQRARHYWIRSVDSMGRFSAWEPDLTTTTAIAYPLVQQRPMVADPFIRLGASYWDVSDSNAAYSVGTGLDGTDSIILSTDSSFGAEVYAAERRGPFEWDVSSSGIMMIEVRWRVKLDVQPGGTWTQQVLPRIRITDEGGGNASFYSTTVAETVYDNTSTADVWTDEVAVIEVEDTGTPPRFIQVGFVVAKNAFGPDFAIDFVDAKILGRPYNGVGLPGLVPAPLSEQGQVLSDSGGWLFPLTEDARNHGLSTFATGTVNSTAINDALALQDRPVYIPVAGDFTVAETIEVKSKKELNLASGLRLTRDAGALTTPIIHMWGDEPVINGNNAQIAHDITAAHLDGVLLVGQDPAETFGGTTDVSCRHPVINDLRISGDSSRSDGSPVMYIHSIRRKLYGTVTADRQPTYKGEFQNITLLNGDVLLEFSSDANAHHFTGLFMLQWTEAAIMFNASYGNVIDGLKLEAPLADTSAFRYAIIEGYQNYSQIETGTAAAYGISHASDNRISGWAELPNSSGDNLVVALFNHKQDAGPSKTGKTWGNHHYDVLGSLGSGLGRDGLSGNDEVGKSSGRTRAVCWNNRIKEKWGNYFNYEPLDDDSGWIKVEGGKACFGGRKASMVEDFEYDLFSVDNVGPTTDTLIVKLTYAGKESGNAGLQSGEILWHCPVRSSTAQEVIEMYHKPAGLSTGGVLTTKPFAFRVTGASGTEANTGKFTFHLTTDDAPATFNGFCKWDVEVSAANSELIASPNLNWAADISILTSSTSGYVSRPIRSRETKYKADDEDKTLDQTMADDADLAGYVLLADELYLVTGEVWATSEAAPDIKWKMNFDQTPQDFKINYEYGSINKVQSGDVDQSQSGLSIFRMDISGYVQTHATLETTAALQWAQINSNATASTFHKGSYLRYTLAKTLLNE